MVLGLMLALFIELSPGVKSNPEAIGNFMGWVFILAVGPLTFIYGYRLQAKWDKERELRNRKPENLRPLKLDGVVKSQSSQTDSQSTDKPEHP